MQSSCHADVWYLNNSCSVHTLNKVKSLIDKVHIKLPSFLLGERKGGGGGAIIQKSKGVLDFYL